MGPYELARARKQEKNILTQSTVKRLGCETLQTKFIKRVQGVKNRAINLAAKGEVGVEPTLAAVMEKTARYVTAIKQTKQTAWSDWHWRYFNRIDT